MSTIEELVKWYRDILRDDLEVANFGLTGNHFEQAVSARSIADIESKLVILSAADFGEDCFGLRVKFPKWDTPTCSDNCGPDVWVTIVKTLAAAHADRYGYQEEWRP